MAVATVSIGAISTSTSEPAPAIPSGSNGDLLTAVVVSNTSASNLATPSGWTLAPDFPKGAGPKFWLFTRIRDGSEGSTLTCDFTGTIGVQSAIVLAWSGHNASFPLGLSVETDTDNTAPGEFIPEGAALVAVGFNDSQNLSAVATLSGDSLTWAEAGEDNTLVCDYALASADTLMTNKTWVPTSGTVTATLCFTITPANREDRVIITTGAGNITSPSSASAVRMRCVGGGGGGSVSTSAEGGGGGGAFAETTSVAVTGGSTIVYYNVGTGGGAGAAGADSWARAGTNSAPSSTTDGCLADGGSGGAAAGQGGGAGGTTANSIGNTEFAGGAGATGQGGGGSRGGSGGGSAGGANATGNNGTAGSGSSPGTGGAATLEGGKGGNGGASGAAGAAGNAPGGGGGGGGNSGGNAGAGARGQVRLIFTLSAPQVGRGDETDTAFNRGLTTGHGQSNETDTAFARTATVIRPTGLATETDSAFQRSLTHGVNRANETDTAFALSQGVIQLPVGQANETDTAFKAGGIAMAPNRPIETDTAFQRSIILQVQRANETDTAFARARLGGVEMAVETDTAFALGKVFILPVGGANYVANGDFSTTDLSGGPLADFIDFDVDLSIVAGRLRVTATAGGVQGQHSRLFVSPLTVGQHYRLTATGVAGNQAAKIELDPAYGGPVVNGTLTLTDFIASSTSLQIRLYISDGASLTIGDFADFDNISVFPQSVEVDTAFALARLDTPAWSFSSETDTAFGFTVGYSHGVSTETDTAFALTGVFDMLPGRADEVDTALARTAVNIRPVGFISETDTARQPGFGQPALRANSTETAFARNALVTYAIGMATEIDTAFQMFGALEAGSGRKPHIRLDSILRDRVQPVHKTV